MHGREKTSNTHEYTYCFWRVCRDHREPIGPIAHEAYRYFFIVLAPRSVDLKGFKNGSNKAVLTLATDDKDEAFHWNGGL